MSISQRRFRLLESFLLKNFQNEVHGASDSLVREMKSDVSFSKKRLVSRNLEDIVFQPDESFSRMLFS